jgi:LuxR family quorum-sensing transcriptional regulator LasR
MKAIERFATLLECSTETEWLEKIFQLGNDFGYGDMLLAAVPNKETSLENAFLRSNYSQQWRSKYDASNFAYVDPTVIHCVVSSIPLIWEPSIFASEKQKEMYEEACAYGLRSGLTLPFHGANSEQGMLCFVNDAKPGVRFMEEAAKSMGELALFRDFVFEATLLFMAKPTEQKTVMLTSRELECLKWCAAGKSSWEIARILHRSEAVVNFHFSNIRRKLDTTTRRQSVVKAIRLGLISPI